MFFVDNSGHTFELTDYTRKPIGYEFDETPYVFWLSDNNENNRLSINNYYCRAINILYPIENISDYNSQSISDILKIDITLNSNIFSFIPSNKFQDAFNHSTTIFDYICAFDDYDVCKEYLESLNKEQVIAFGNEYHISSNEADKIELIRENILSKLIFNKQELSSENDDDFVVIKVTENDKNYILIPIYVIGNASEEGTWSSTALLHISYKYIDKDVWCPFSVGGTFVDSYEALIIHGKNMGVTLPKDIIKALYGTSFFNDEFDMEIYNKKLKEYMLNYMAIKGECGNYNSALTSLKWFGWQDKVSLYKLIETTNEFKHQFIRDYFDIHTDIIEVFKNFINTQYVSLQVRLNIETGELDKQDLNKDFWGEGNRLLHGLINENTLVNTKEYFLSQEFSYVDSYFKYSFNELLLKISCLSYYYKKYFLPLYLQLQNVSVEYKVYGNQIKLYSYAKDHFFENIVNLCAYQDIVTFDPYHVRYLTHQYHYVDSNYNEFYINGLGDEGKYAEHKDMWYLINDSCISVPIHFKYWEDDPERNYYNCMLFLKDDESNKAIFTSSFAFYQTEDIKYNAFIIYPKLLEQNNPVIKQNYINKKFTLYLYVNGTYFEYKFQIKAPEFDVSLGTLEYKYWDNDINYLNEQYHSLDKVDTELYANTDASGITVKSIYLVKGNIIDESNKILEEIPNGYLLRTNSLEVINATPEDEYYIIVSYDLNTLGLKELRETDIIMTINNENIATISHCEFDSYNSISHIKIKINEDINTTGCTSLAINVNGHIAPIYINNSQVYFAFHDAEDTEYSEALNITEYIKHYDFFDEPTNYMSPFVQIDSIDEENNKVIFNTFMHEPEFVSINDLNLCLPLSNDKGLNDLIEKYKDTVNISNNYKYLNNVHLYELYGVNEASEDNYTNEHDILKFYKDIMVRVGNTVVSKSKISNTFTVAGFTDDTIRTDEGYNHYALSTGEPELIEGHAWYYILKRNQYNQITGENANSLYSIYNDENSRHDVGYLIFDDYRDIRNNVNPLYNGLTIDYNKVELINSQFIYHYKSHHYVLNYTNTFVRLVNGRYEEFQPSTTDFHYNYANIFIKMNFFYYDEIKILNVFGYYNSNSLSNVKCSNYDPENKTCTVTIYDPEDNDELIANATVQLYPSKYYEYTDIETDGLIYNQNASAVWTILDENDNLIPNDIINELTLEYYTEDTLDQLTMPESTVPAYINYLVKDLTGTVGKYRLACDTESNNIKVILAVKDKNNASTRYEASMNNIGADISLYGDEKEVILYFEIGAYDNVEGIDFTPHLYKYEITEFGITYNPDNEVEMYKKLFYKKYSLILNKGEEEIVLKDIWDAKLKFNDNYDTYLMHGYKDKNHTEKDDPQTWYIVFISKDTCDKFENIAVLNKYPETIEFTNGLEKYILRHVQSEKLFLINRMKLKKSTGINHFKKDDLVVCSLENNPMLPTNFELHSKWNIKPLTFGMDTNIRIIGNGNMSILSIPKNDSNYNRGYYEIEVQYSLNRSFVNNQFIKKKILIEK